MSFRSDLGALVLGVLEAGPKHGYAIVKELNGEGSGAIRLGEGQLYPTLHKLERDGLVNGEWSDRSGKPPRKVYSLTPEGKSRLTDDRRTWEKFRSGVDRLLRV